MREVLQQTSRRAPRSARGGALTERGSRDDQFWGRECRSPTGSATPKSTLFTPREKPRAVSVDRASPRCAQDHLWRELFHAEADEQRRTRLNREGEAIGRRGKASSGIPWRQIPSFDEGGRMTGTGDPLRTTEVPKRASAMPYRKQSMLSTQFWGGGGMKGVLEPVREDPKTKVSAGDAQVQRGDETPFSSRDGKTSLVAQHLQRRYNKQSPRGAPAVSEGGSISALDRYALDSGRSVVHDDPAAHFTYRQQKSGIQKTYNTKDSCPFSRADGDPEARQTQDPTPHKRLAMSPSPSLVGAATPRTPAANAADVRGSKGHGTFQVAEKVMEARRDWVNRQENPELDELSLLSPQSTFMSKSVSARSFNAQSVGSFNAQMKSSMSQQTLVSVSNPIHSVRARPTTLGNSSGKQRWRR